MSLTFNAQDFRDIKDSFCKRELKYEYHSSIITYNKLGANFTRISTVIAVSVLGCQQMASERKI